MSPLGLASSRSCRVALVLSVLSVAAAARADGQPTLLVFAPSPPPDAARWAERVARVIGPVELDAETWSIAVVARDGVLRARLVALARIEQQLVGARESAAALSEREALAALAAAADAGEQLADMPGSAAWNAEIQLWLAVTAAQAGLPDLAQSAFQRAAALDPSRHLLEGEAAPEIVAQSERVQRQIALGPRGEIAVRVRAPVAQVLLDDIPQGAAPVRMRAAVGRHVLRVEAPGYVPYGAFIDVFEGQRPTIVVAPVRSPTLERALTLERAAARGDYRGVIEAFAALEQAGARPARVLVIETAGEHDRALLVACEMRGCQAPLRVAGSELPIVPVPSATGWSAQRLERERAWLARGTAVPRGDPAPWWHRWYVWGPLAVVAVGTTALALSIGPQPEQRLRVVVEPGDLGK